MIRIYKYGDVPNCEIFARTEPTVNVSEIVSGIIADVRKRGDEALFELTKKFDKAELTTLAVSEEEFEEALGQVEPEFLEVLKKAAEKEANAWEVSIREEYEMKSACSLGSLVLWKS